MDGVPAYEEDRLSNMASSLQGLSEAVARELAIGGAQYVIIATEGAHVIQLRVPGQQLVLAAVFELDETLVRALATCRYAVERFAAALADALTVAESCTFATSVRRVPCTDGMNHAHWAAALADSGCGAPPRAHRTRLRASFEFAPSRRGLDVPSGPSCPSCAS